MFNNIYGHVPGFRDVFDEETFYVFSALFTIATLIVTIVLSRFITIKPKD